MPGQPVPIWSRPEPTPKVVVIRDQVLGQFVVPNLSVIAEPAPPPSVIAHAPLPRF